MTQSSSVRVPITNRQTASEMLAHTSCGHISVSRLAAGQCVQWSLTYRGTVILKDLELPSLAERWKHQRLIFRCKVASGLIPAAVPNDSCLMPLKNKRQTRPNRSEYFRTTDIVDRSARKNSRCGSETTVFPYAQSWGHTGTIYKTQFALRQLRGLNLLPCPV